MHYAVSTRDSVPPGIESLRRVTEHQAAVNDRLEKTLAVVDPPLVYIAGPYSGPDRGAIEANIRRAELLGLQVAGLGGMPVCPHSNTSHPGFELAQNYDFWIKGTLKLLRVCDAVIMTSDWARSNGARGEYDEAVRLGMPVFLSVDELKVWLEGRR